MSDSLMCQQEGEKTSTMGGRTAPSRPTPEQIQTVDKLESLYNVQDWRGMLEMIQEATSVAEQLRETQPEEAAFIYSSLGNCYSKVGKPDSAIEMHSKHMLIAEETGDRVGLGMSYANLGVCYHRMGESAKAIPMHQQAKSIAEELGDRAELRAACTNLALCFESMGEYDSAVPLHEQAKTLAEEIGDRELVGAACANLGLAYYEIGEYSKGMALHQLHKSVGKQVGEGVGRACNNLGAALIETGEWAAAGGVLASGLTVFQDGGTKLPPPLSCHSLALTSTSGLHL